MLQGRACGLVAPALLRARTRDACTLRRPSMRPASTPAMRPLATTTTPSRPVVVAVDGPAASGKGTLAKQLAQACRLAYLDTGMLYRTVAYKALEAGVPLTDEPALALLAAQLSSSSEDLTAGGPELRSERVGAAASQVSALPAVRREVTLMPRAFVQRLPAGVLGCVLDGRDVGTVIFPDAQLKIFLVASPQVRAERRLLELRGRGDTTTTLEEVLKGVLERDARDSGRATAPLKAAPDAHLLDSSLLGPEEVMQRALGLVREHCPQLLVTLQQHA